MTALNITGSGLIKGYDEPLPRPLTAADIPEKSLLVSPRAGNHHGYAPPHYPGTPEFDAQLKTVTDVRDMVCRDIWPAEFLMTNNPGEGGEHPPELLIDALGFMLDSPDNAHIAALAVSMDRPADLGTVIFEELAKRQQSNAQYIDFVSGFNKFQVELAAVNHAALERVFDVKYFYMLERPETVLGVSGPVFCEDEVGAPGHPAYGAGHAAVSGATAELITSRWFRNDEFRNKVFDAAWQFASWRTLLGVHYPQDNEIGFQIGRDAAKELIAVL